MNGNETRSHLHLRHLEPNDLKKKKKKKNHVIPVFYQAHYMLFIRYDKDETPGERRENLKHNFAIFFRFKKKKKKKIV